MGGSSQVNSSQGPDGEELAQRKTQHISVCVNPDLPVEGGSAMFDHIQFIHRSLPEIHADSIDSRQDFLGYSLDAPVLISCMTGGSAEGFKLNKILAEAAQESRFAVGTGSLRIMLRKPEVLEHFNFKKLAPDVPLIGNIGAVQLPELFADDKLLLRQFLEMTKKLEIDALAVHLNPGQEIFQIDGDRDFSHLLSHIQQLCEFTSLPIIAKETGAGIAPDEASALFSAGVHYVDIAGAGGTNWMSVEALRLDQDSSQLDEDFASWGLQSAPAFAAAYGYCSQKNQLQAGRGIIASGGLRKPVDFAKALAMGASLAGSALPFIRAAQHGGLTEVLDYSYKIKDALHKVMLLTGSADIGELRNKPLLFSSEFEHKRDSLIDSAAVFEDLRKTAPLPESRVLAEDTPREELNVLVSRNFRKKSIRERRVLLQNDSSLNLDGSDFEASGHSDDMLDLADIMVETAVGFMPIPLGIARNFLIDGQTVHMPMAVEEPSVIAAAGYAAGIIARHGGFTTVADDPIIQSYVYLAMDKDTGSGTANEATVKQACADIIAAEDRIRNELSALLAPMEKRGGGFRGIETAWLPESQCIRVELSLNVCNAMGANLANSAAEQIVNLLESISGGKKLMAILSNQARQRTAMARFSISYSGLKRGNYAGKELAERIVRLNDIANEDPARAVTHNKGIMNGVTSLVIATGNDSRAVEAAAHARAAQDGGYRSLTRYRIEGENLIGELQLPMALGTVGGAVSFHPVAKTSLQILGKPDSMQLARYAVCLGLAQNFAALSALAGEGIQQGHMRLHAQRLAFSAGARGREIDQVSNAIQESGVYNSQQAELQLKTLRTGGTT